MADPACPCEACPTCGAPVTDPVQARGIRANRRASLGAEIVQAEGRLRAIPRDGRHETERWIAGVRLANRREHLRRMEADHADR